MHQEAFKAMVEEIFALSPHGHDNIAGLIHFTNDGVLATASESCGTVGFGIASGMTVSHDVLSVIEKINRTMTFGHYWLAEGADANNWSLICGFKFSYDHSDLQATGNLIFTLMQHSGSLASAVQQQLGDAPYRPYWLPDVGNMAQALVLTGQLS